MKSRQHLSLLVGLPIAWLLLASPVSARDENVSVHDARDDEHGDDHAQLNAPRADAHYRLFYAEQGGDRNISSELAAYQLTRDEEDKQEHLDTERQGSRERKSEAHRYYWWWPFR